MAEHVPDRAEFLDTKLKPKLEAAIAGQGHVFFVDAAHFVFGTFFCCLWSFTQRRALYGRYHPTFRDFRAAIQEVLDGVSTKYSQQLASLITLNIQQFDDVSLTVA